MTGNGRPSPSSSIDSSCPSMSTTTSLSQARDLSTELRLGFSMSTSSLQHSSSKEREKVSDWPPIKPLFRSTLLQIDNQRHLRTLFVKVYMEGFPIGRKLDLYSFSSYDDLLKTLCRMFRTTIMCPEIAQMPSHNAYVLTYEDKEGDWMMVGDVPWELFLTTVKRVKITRADKC